MHVVLRMRYDRLLLMDAVVFYIYSMGTLMFARQFLDLHGVHLDTAGVFTAQAAAAVFFAFSTMNVWAKKLTDIKALHVIMDANMLKHFLSLIVCVGSYVSGSLEDSRSLSFVLLFFIFSVAFGFYHFSRKEYVMVD